MELELGLRELPGAHMPAMHTLGASPGILGHWKPGPNGPIRPNPKFLGRARPDWYPVPGLGLNMQLEQHVKPGSGLNM